MPYLTPVQTAMQMLKVPGRLSSKSLVVCPGFPRGSFFSYSIDGRFEGSYNRMYLVVDKADQLVSVQLVEETPRRKKPGNTEDLGWHTYNFVIPEQRP